MQPGVKVVIFTPGYNWQPGIKTSTPGWRGEPGIKVVTFTPG
jgi:hypothetical protein